MNGDGHRDLTESYARFLCQLLGGMCGWWGRIGAALSGRELGQSVR